MELRGSMRVFCRVKPVPMEEEMCVFLEEAADGSSMQQIEIGHQSGFGTLFHFDRVFSGRSTQA